MSSRNRTRFHAGEPPSCPLQTKVCATDIHASDIEFSTVIHLVPIKKL